MTSAVAQLPMLAPTLADHRLIGVDHPDGHQPV
jgi:hypothetical protein